MTDNQYFLYKKYKNLYKQLAGNKECKDIISLDECCNTNHCNPWGVKNNNIKRCQKLGKSSKNKICNHTLKAKPKVKSQVPTGKAPSSRNSSRYEASGTTTMPARVSGRTVARISSGLYSVVKSQVKEIVRKPNKISQEVIRPKEVRQKETQNKLTKYKYILKVEDIHGNSYGFRFTKQIPWITFLKKFKEKTGLNFDDVVFLNLELNINR